MSAAPGPKTFNVNACVNAIFEDESSVPGLHLHLVVNGGSPYDASVYLA